MNYETEYIIHKKDPTEMSVRTVDIYTRSDDDTMKYFIFLKFLANFVFV